ncbi:hypothetical protein JCM8547_002512 [Rhodosporidiobolus lusitaniae]
MNTPRSPAARAIANNVADYFSLSYEGNTKTPLNTPAPSASVSSRRHGTARLDVLALERTLNGLKDLSTLKTPTERTPMSFTAAGACLAPSSPIRSSSLSSKSSGSLSARRRPELRISDLPPLVMLPPKRHAPALSLEKLHLDFAGGMKRDASKSSFTSVFYTTEEESDVETVVGWVSYVGSDAEGAVGKVVDGKRVPTPYPERCAWIADSEAELYF